MLESSNLRHWLKSTALASEGTNYNQAMYATPYKNMRDQSCDHLALHVLQRRIPFYECKVYTLSTIAMAYLQCIY